MKNLIAFVGFKSSGKNTAAIPLIAEGYTAFSFADSLKDCLASIFCWDRQMLEGITAESRTWREQVDVWWADKLGIPDFTPRWAMTHFGTQIMRQHFNNDIWLYNVERRIMAIDGPVVLTDCRFPNEIRMARHFNGKVVRLRRGPDPHWMGLAEQANAGDTMAASTLKSLGIHESEWAWISTPVDDIVENDCPVEELYEKVMRIYDSTNA